MKKRTLASTVIISLILLIVGGLGYNSTLNDTKAQSNLSNKYLLARTIPNKVKKQSPKMYILRTKSGNKLQYISMTSKSNKYYNGKYHVSFNYVHTPKINGKIITSTKQFKKDIPNQIKAGLSKYKKGTTMYKEAKEQINQSLSQQLKLAKKYKITFVGKKDKSISMITPTPQAKKPVVKALLYHHKSTIKKLKKLAKAEEKAQAKMQKQEQEAQQQGVQSQQGQSSVQQ